MLPPKDGRECAGAEGENRDWRSVELLRRIKVLGYGDQADGGFLSMDPGARGDYGSRINSTMVASCSDTHCR